jgi:hypothetical protein
VLELRTRLKNGKNKGGRLLRSAVTSKEFDILFVHNYSATFESTFGDTIIPIIQENQELFFLVILKTQISEITRFRIRRKADGQGNCDQSILTELQNK